MPISPSWPRRRSGSSASAGNGQAAARPKPNAAARPSPKTWNAAVPRLSPQPAWPAATPSGYASSTRPARTSTCAGSSSTSPPHLPLRPGRKPPGPPPIPAPPSCPRPTRPWDSRRSFYLALSGRYDVFIDARLIRPMGPGDHFGELAARDWGGGYGYARLATIRCAEPGRLLRLTSEDFQWLIDTEPAVKAKPATTLAGRLQQR